MLDGLIARILGRRSEAYDVSDGKVTKVAAYRWRGCIYITHMEQIKMSKPNKINGENQTVETKDEASVADRFKRIVVEHLGVKLSRVTDDASILKDLGADSLDGVELVMAAEDEFGIEIPDGDADDMKQTIGGAIKYLQDRLANEKA